MRTSIGAIAFGVLVVALLVPASAVAQRGGGYVVREQGTDFYDVPGFFDTHTLRRGEVVVSAPLLDVTYGVTDHLAVSVNGLALLSSASGTPAALAQARYRFHESGRTKLVLDASIFGLRLRDEELGLFTVLAAGAGTNVSRRLSDKAQITAGARAFRVVGTNVEIPDTPMGYEETIGAVAIMATVAVEYKLSSWLIGELDAFAVPVVLGSLDTSTASATVEGIGEVPTVFRFFAKARLGSWQLGAGAFAVPEERSVNPWFTLGRKWK